MVLQVAEEEEEEEEGVMRVEKRAIATLAGAQGITAALVAHGSFHGCSQFTGG